MNNSKQETIDIQPRQALKAIFTLSLGYSAVVFSMAQLFVIMR